MEYDRLGPSSEPRGSDNKNDRDLATSESSQPVQKKQKKNAKLIVLSVVAAALILAAAVSAAIVVGLRIRNGRGSDRTRTRKPTRAISQTCSKTLYPNLCIDSLLDFPGSLAAGEQDLVHISVNVTLQRFSKALYSTSSITYLQMPPRVRSAYDACLELLEDSVDALSRSLSSITATSGASKSDVVTWLSAAMTSQDTCSEEFATVDGEVKGQIGGAVEDLSELVSNALAIFSSAGEELSGVPVGNGRRRLMELEGDSNNELPSWIRRRERELLDIPTANLQADIVVSKDGNGTYKTIAEAIKKAPEHSDRRIVIHVRAGRYEEENLKVGRKKTNLMFIGDGKGKTVITGGKSVLDNLTTFHTASFATTGAGFIARDITFENYAGPAKHQAVALRVGGDHAVVYRCAMIGYQDALYVHSNRQFFRECDVYGTVDFIFGNAAVVFQNCNIYARKPMAQQKNTITAQNRKDPNQNTGISIHACQILATPDLEAVRSNVPTYLGRPWKPYSRVVYMLSYLGDHIHPRGWLEWNATTDVDKLYYGEYMNRGPGAATGQRVKWPGYRVIKSQVEAGRFTVAQFIAGSAWLPSTGVAFLGGLNN